MGDMCWECLVANNRANGYAEDVYLYLESLSNLTIPLLSTIKMLNVRSLLRKSS